MKTNMGSVDRLARILIAAIIVVLFLINVIAGTLATVLLVIAGIFLLTGLVGLCPLYSLLGINTCGIKKA